MTAMENFKLEGLHNALTSFSIEVDHLDLVSLLSFILRSLEAVKWYNTIKVTMAFLLIITLRTYIAP